MHGPACCVCLSELLLFLFIQTDSSTDWMAWIAVMCRCVVVDALFKLAFPHLNNRECKSWTQLELLPPARNIQDLARSLEEGRCPCQYLVLDGMLNSSLLRRPFFRLSSILSSSQAVFPRVLAGARRYVAITVPSPMFAYLPLPVVARRSIKKALRDALIV